MAAIQTKRLTRMLTALAFLPLLSACINDRTATEVGGNQLLTVIREQQLPWSNAVDLSLVVARMPTCQRRHSLDKGTAQTKIELWQYRGDTFIIKAGDKLYATETYSCEGLDRLKEAPPEGMGTLLGTYQDKNGVFAFVSAPKAPAETAPAPIAPAAAPEAAPAPVAVGVPPTGAAGVAPAAPPAAAPPAPAAR